MQSYPYIEYIIVDGASTDNTLKIIREYEDKVKYISESDKGLYDALNKAVDLATGDYIQFIGSDDCLYDNNAIQRVVDYINEHPNKDFYCGNRLRVWKDADVFLEKMEFNNMMEHVKDEVLFWTPHTSLFVKASIMKKEKFVCDFKIAADYYFILKSFYVDKYQFSFMNFPVAYFSDGGISANSEKCEEENKKIMTRLDLIASDKKENIVKQVISKIGLKNVKKYYHLKIKGDWKKHHCNNKICRWCGRK